MRTPYWCTHAAHWPQKLQDTPDQVRIRDLQAEIEEVEANMQVRVGVRGCENGSAVMCKMM